VLLRHSGCPLSLTRMVKGAAEARGYERVMMLRGQRRNILLVPNRVRFSPRENLPAPDLLQDVGEFLLDLAHELGTRSRNDRKIFEPFERPTGIDYGA
jgi:hypothetical protein